MEQHTATGVLRLVPVLALGLAAAAFLVVAVFFGAAALVAVFLGAAAFFGAAALVAVVFCIKA